MTFDAKVSAAELNETYFVAFQRAVQSPNPPSGYMCRFVERALSAHKRLECSHIIIMSNHQLQCLERRARMRE